MTLHRSHLQAFSMTQTQAWEGDLEAFISMQTWGAADVQDLLTKDGGNPEDPWDALSLATWRGHEAVMTVLLGMGCVPHPGMHRVGSPAAAHLLRERCDWPAPGDQAVLDRALCAAVEDLQPGMVRHWLAQGANPRAMTTDRQTPVHAMLQRTWAPSTGRDPTWPSCDDASLPERLLDTLNLLLDAGVPVDVRNGFGETPLVVAVKCPNSSVAQDLHLTAALRLVQAGAHVNAMGGSGSVLWAALAAVGPVSEPALWDLEAIRRAPHAVPGGEDLIQALLDRGATLVLPSMRTEPTVHGGVKDLRTVRYTVPSGALTLGAMPDGSETVLLRAVRSRSLAALDHAIGLGANLTALGHLVPGRSSTAAFLRSPTMLAVELGWAAGIDRLARALEASGVGLDEDMGHPLWQSERLALLPGKVRLERRVLEHALRPDGDAVAGPDVARERGRTRL